MLLVRIGRFADAGPLLEQAVELDPSLADAHVFLARVYFETGARTTP